MFAFYLILVVKYSFCLLTTIYNNLQLLAMWGCSSPINLVDFGTGLFLNKTPSEESGGSGGPHSAGSGGPPLSESPHTEGSSSSFFPSNIISSVGASVGAMGASVGASVGAMGASVGAMGASVGASVGAMGASVGASVGAVGYVAACPCV